MDFKIWFTDIVFLKYMDKRYNVTLYLHKSEQGTVVNDIL